MRCLLPLLLAPLLAACGTGEEKQQRPPPLVKAEAAQTQNFTDVYAAIGTATANEQVTLTAPVTERIVRLGFGDGAFVRRGQLIAELAQGQESAALASAAARAREADQQLQRLQVLKDRGFATKANYDTQVAALAAAQAAAAEARASIGDRVIRAPFSGVASLRQISVGAVVGAGTPIATISDISRIKLDFTVPETMLARLAVGQAIVATAAAFPGQSFGGTVSAIDPVIDPATRAVRLRAELPNPAGRLRPGMMMTVMLESRARTAVAVPELAIVNEGEARFVYVPQSDGTVKRTPVTTGGRSGALVEVTGGLTAGTRIITEGVVKLSDGMKVRLAGAEGGAPAAKDAAAR